MYDERICLTRVEAAKAMGISLPTLDGFLNREKFQIPYMTVSAQDALKPRKLIPVDLLKEWIAQECARQEKLRQASAGSEATSDTSTAFDGQREMELRMKMECEPVRDDPDAVRVNAEVEALDAEGASLAKSMGEVAECLVSGYTSLVQETLEKLGFSRDYLDEHGDEFSMIEDADYNIDISHNGEILFRITRTYNATKNGGIVSLNVTPPPDLADQDTPTA